jgi:FtsZ-interacting cell division protein ZipA
MAGMDPKILIIIAVVVIAVVVIAWAVMRKRRSEALQRRFGPEYQRTLREHGPSKAEAVLLQREKRVEKLNLRELAVDERERFITEWRTTQSRFVDDPKGAVNDADSLVTNLMQARGYPMSDFDQRAADISVDHPRVVDNYRAAHEIALRHRRGEATTEDMRNAMIYYRSLFDELLQTRTISEREVA